MYPMSFYPPSIHSQPQGHFQGFPQGLNYGQPTLPRGTQQLRTSVMGGFPQRQFQQAYQQPSMYPNQYAPKYPYAQPQYQYAAPAQPTTQTLPTPQAQNPRQSYYQNPFVPQHFASRMIMQQPQQSQVLQSPSRPSIMTSPLRQNAPQQQQQMFMTLSGLPMQMPVQMPVQMPGQMPGQRIVLQSPSKNPIVKPAQKQAVLPAQPQKASAPKPESKKQVPQQPVPKRPEPAQVDDLDKRFAEAIKRSKQIVDQHQPLQQKPQEKQPIEQPMSEEATDELEELALQYEDGFIYRGQGFQPATRHGYGILTDQDDNEIYAGHWDKNQYEGQGRLNNLQQETLDGPIDWHNMQTIENGWAHYEGNFQQGKMHGNGQLTLTNGEKYVGEFSDGMIEGEGEFYTADNNIIKGVWQAGVLQE